ncbi:MAG: hypothetical protein AAGA11_14320 [Pseudomonadota bacterium]
MIEDALKSTRTLHRLIMTVSLVTIVFALSVERPADTARQQALVNGLIGLDLSPYDAFVAEKVESAREAVLQPIADQIAKHFDEQAHLVFGLDTLAAAFAEPIHVGKVLVADTVLSEVDNASVISLNALNGLSLTANAQVLVPRVDGLLDEIDAFIRDNPGAGRRVAGIDLALTDFSFVAESFLPGESVTVGLHFELLDAVRVGGVPVFSASFEADIIELENSDFVTWVRSQSFDDTVVTVRGDELVFAPTLADDGGVLRTDKLGVLSQRLADNLAASSPTARSVSILGTTIPGSLAIFASPLILLSLCSYFCAHTRHLTRIVDQEPALFTTFAWLPLSLRGRLELPWTRQRILVFAAGAFESLVSAGALPALALGLLFLRLNAFGNLSALNITVLLGAGLGVTCASLLTFGNVSVLHSALEQHDVAED